MMARKIAEWKRRLVDSLARELVESAVVGIVNLERFPAAQLELLRGRLRQKLRLKMVKKSLLKLALEQAERERPNISGLTRFLVGMPALIFSEEGAFRLQKLLAKSRIAAPAKPGQLAPHNIVIPKGPTPFAPGPMIGELSALGIKVGVEAGKIALKADFVAAKAGQAISQKIAALLAKFGIEPMKLGLSLVAAYEDGVLYPGAVLTVDEAVYLEKVMTAESQARGLALETAWPAPELIEELLCRAHSAAFGLGIEAMALEPGIIEELLGRAYAEASGLAAQLNI